MPSLLADCGQPVLLLQVGSLGARDLANRRMFLACVDRTAAALAEVEAYLELARELELISADDHRELESLGGRALFYVMKLAMSLDPAKERERESREQ